MWISGGIHLSFMLRVIYFLEATCLQDSDLVLMFDLSVPAWVKDGEQVGLPCWALSETHVEEEAQLTSYHGIVGFSDSISLAFHLVTTRSYCTKLRMCCRRWVTKCIFPP